MTTKITIEIDDVTNPLDRSEALDRLQDEMHKIARSMNAKTNEPLHKWAPTLDIHSRACHSERIIKRELAVVYGEETEIAPNVATEHAGNGSPLTKEMYESNYDLNVMHNPHNANTGPSMAVSGNGKDNRPPSRLTYVYPTKPGGAYIISDDRLKSMTISIGDDTDVVAPGCIFNGIEKRVVEAHKNKQDEDKAIVKKAESAKSEWQPDEAKPDVMDITKRMF